MPLLEDHNATNELTLILKDQETKESGKWLLKFHQPHQQPFLQG